MHEYPRTARHCRGRSLRRERRESAFELVAIPVSRYAWRQAASAIQPIATSLYQRQWSDICHVYRAFCAVCKLLCFGPSCTKSQATVLAISATSARETAQTTVQNPESKLGSDPLETSLPKPAVIVLTASPRFVPRAEHSALPSLANRNNSTATPHINQHAILGSSVSHHCAALRSF